METTGEKKARASRLARALAASYPQARISLNFETPWQCLVATILSAQCTDERVNEVTPALFRAIPTIEQMAQADPAIVEKLVMPTGFFRQKTKSIQGAAQMITQRFGGHLPQTMEDLVRLPGVGRKTANVLLGHVFSQPGLVVDTHVRRVAFRLGLTAEKDPEVIETDLQKLLPPPQWTPFSMRLILHGRKICVARAPKCEICPLIKDCPRRGLTDKSKRRFAD